MSRSKQGTRHTTLTALSQELPERALRQFSRHRPAASLDHYTTTGYASGDRAGAAYPFRRVAFENERTVPHARAAACKVKL